MHVVPTASAAHIGAALLRQVLTVDSVSFEPSLMESAMNAPPQAAARSSSASASATRRNAALSGLTEVTGRVLLALLFLLSGVGKLCPYSATAAYMSSAGGAGALLPAVIATELGGALAIMLRWETPGVAALPAG